MCTWIWNLKTMPVNNEDAHLLTQDLGEKLVISEALFRSISCFQCSWNLQGIIFIFYLLAVDLRIVKFMKKNHQAVFSKNAKFVGMDQITCKSCNKSNWMQHTYIHTLLTWLTLSYKASLQVSHKTKNKPRNHIKLHKIIKLLLNLYTKKTANKGQ